MFITSLIFGLLFGLAALFFSYKADRRYKIQKLSGHLFFAGILFLVGWLGTLTVMFLSQSVGPYGLAIGLAILLGTAFMGMGAVPWEMVTPSKQFATWLTLCGILAAIFCAILWVVRSI